MGIGRDVANIIARASRQQPFSGRTLLCGRQSMDLTPQETASLLLAHGIEPHIPPEECEFDVETRIGGEGQARRASEKISDRKLFPDVGCGRPHGA